MYIEDLVQTLANCSIRINMWDKKVVASFSTQIFAGTGFTEKQATLALKILQKHATTLSLYMKSDIISLIKEPQYRLHIRKSTGARAINIIDYEKFGKSIEVKFPYDENLVSQIKKFKSKAGDISPIWDSSQTSWIFPLNESTICFVSTIIYDVTFDASQEFLIYHEQVKKITGNIDQYAPMLSIHNKDLKIINPPAYMPNLDTDNIIEAVFRARQLGVTLWDDLIEQYISSGEVVSAVCTFLKNQYAASFFTLENNESGVICLEHIVKYLGPSLFIIPGGDELNKITQAYTLLKGMNIDDKNISVLFRLPAETGSNFNSFVKNHSINGPINDQTKIVFVSGKLPKTIIKSGIVFNSVVNFGFDNAHYTLKEFVKTHPNLVYFDVNSSASKGLHV
jgi:hypothetical protein